MLVSAELAAGELMSAGFQVIAHRSSSSSSSSSSPQTDNQLLPGLTGPLACSGCVTWLMALRAGHSDTNSCLQECHPLPLPLPLPPHYHNHCHSSQPALTLCYPAILLLFIISCSLEDAEGDRGTQEGSRQPQTARSHHFISSSPDST